MSGNKKLMDRTDTLPNSKGDAKQNKKKTCIDNL